MKRSIAQDAIRKALAKSGAPLSATELGAVLEKGHKTTVYRALGALMATRTIREVRIHGGAARYETNDRGHHHHLVCTGCRKIEHVELPCKIGEVERLIGKKSNFSITGHEAEFFGVCGACAKK